MAPRYVTRPKSQTPPKPKAWGTEHWYDDDDHYVLKTPDLTVQDSTDPEFTGLLNADGDPLFREPNRIGFIWHDDVDLEEYEEDDAPNVGANLS